MSSRRRIDEGSEEIASSTAGATSPDDLANRQLVGRRGEMVVITFPQVQMTREQALIHAAWLVILADEDDDFPSIVAAIKAL